MLFYDRLLRQLVHEIYSKTYIHFCLPIADVDVTALTFESGAVFPKATAKAGVEFSVTFKNIRTKDIAAITGK
jgi:hypothetical protein